MRCPRTSPEPKQISGSRLLWLPDGALLVVDAAMRNPPAVQLRRCRLIPPPGPRTAAGAWQLLRITRDEPKPVAIPLPPAQGESAQVWS